MMCSAICCLTRHMMDGGASRQTAAGGSVVPVLRDTSGYTLAVIFNPLSPPSSSPSSSLASFLFPPTAEQVEGRKKGWGWGGGWVSAANRSLGSCVLLIFYVVCLRFFLRGLVLLCWNLNSSLTRVCSEPREPPWSASCTRSC